MHRILLLLPLLLTSEAQAQIYVGSGGFFNQSGFSVGIRKHHFSFTASFSNSAFSSFGYGPSPLYSGWYAPPSIVIVNPRPVFILPPERLPPPIPELPPGPAPEPVRKGGWIRFDPAPPADPAKPFPPPPLKPLPPPEPIPPPLREVDLGVLPLELSVEKAEVVGRNESLRQMQLAREAFADGQYGRVVDRCRVALLADPTNGTACFIMAQGYTALGKYRQAVTMIGEGLRLRPDWPTTRFQPRQLYGDQVRLFDEHLANLKELALSHPQDGVLQFLLGYQLWFDGRNAEARETLKRVEAPAELVKLAGKFLEVR